MKVVVQRVSKAFVSVDNQVVGSIKEGLMLLVGFTEGDTLKNIDYRQYPKIKVTIDKIKTTT